MVQEPILIYTSALSKRLDYICKFIFRDVLQVPFVFSTSYTKAQNHLGVVINYSAEQLANAIQIIPNTLLFEDSIQQQKINISSWEGLPIFFRQENQPIPFDIFAASFYLVSRYEEYLPFQKDEYGRFAHKESLAFQNNFLHLPLVDIWCWKLFSFLQQKDNTIQSNKKYKEIFTVDVDMISAYKHKNSFKQLGASIRDLLQGKTQEAKQRIQVLLFGKQDPFDSFNFIAQHLAGKEKIAFVLFAEKNSQFDKHLLPSNKVMNSFIHQLKQSFDSIGIHPSYTSSENIALISTEKNKLQTIVEKPITLSRQHYIRYAVPSTFEALQSAGITKDYSVGYGSINGFRASTCTPHLFYNLSKESAADLRLFPFCWMDANSFFEQKQTAAESQAEYLQYRKQIQEVNGTFISIWHNFVLNHNAKDWQNMFAAITKNN
jgi:hypothetical protein